MFNPVYIGNKLLKTFEMFVLTFKHAYYAPKMFTVILKHFKCLYWKFEHPYNSKNVV